MGLVDDEWVGVYAADGSWSMSASARWLAKIISDGKYAVDLDQLTIAYRFATTVPLVIS